MQDASLSVNTWDLLNILVGVAIYVIILMSTQYMPPYVVRLCVSGMWLLFVTMTMLLQNAIDGNVDPDTVIRISRVVNLVNLGMSLCAVLYELSFATTRTALF